MADLRTNIKENVILFEICAIVSFIFLLLHSVTTSPLWIGAYSDSAFFLILGRFFLMEEIPYVDYFDHKGPILIFIEAFGQLLHSDERTGVFIFQIISLSVSLFFLHKLSASILNRTKSIIVSLIFLCFLALVLADGNRVEEFCLPLLMIPLYITVKNIFNKSNNQDAPKAIEIIAIGICSGLIFWMRLNNLAVICACVLYMIWHYASTRNWIYLSKYIAYIGLGFSIVTISTIAYFYHINALSEMLYASFTFNFEYAKIASTIANSDSGDELSAALKIRFYTINSLPFLFLIASVIYYSAKNEYKRKDVIILSLLFLFFSLLATQIGLKSLAYLIAILPITAFAAILFLFDKYKQKTERWILFLTIFILFGLSVLKVYQKRDYNREMSIYQENVKEIINTIPKEDLKQVMVYQTEVTFMFESKLSPYNRYFISQDRHGRIAPHIFNQINETLENNPPKWLVIEYKKEKPNNQHFELIRDRKYNIFFENDSFLLYRLKPEYQG